MLIASDEEHELGEDEEGEHSFYDNMFDESDKDDMGHGHSSDSIPDLRDSLVDWAIEVGISLMALSILLSILKCHHPLLPKDGRTLLRTKKFKVKTLAGGVFYYFGILNSFQNDPG